MKVDKILTFLASTDSIRTERPDIETIKEFSYTSDEVNTINWKKTAQLWNMMSNSFEKNPLFSANIITVFSTNWNKGVNNTASDVAQECIQTIKKHVWDNNYNSIQEIQVSSLSKATDALQIKSIIISDFLWWEKDINICLQACKNNIARCIIIPLLTPTGIFQHPLQKKFPQYFWSIDL